MDVHLSRATMANWIIHTAKEWLDPLWQLMKEELLEFQQVIYADETVVQVLREPGWKPTSESQMWVCCAGEIGGPSNILFEYQPTRHDDHAKGFLGDFSGYLVWAGYNKVNRAIRCGCWSHLRRNRGILFQKTFA